MMSTPLAVFAEPFLAGGHTVEVCAAQSRFSASGGLVMETRTGWSGRRRRMW